MPHHLSREQCIEEATDTVEDTSFQSSTSSAPRQPSPIPEPPKPPTPEPPKEQPKYVQGMLAVCSHCGYLSEDFNKCLRCKRKLPEDVKSIAAGDQSITKKNESKTLTQQDKPKSTPSPTTGSKTNGKYSDFVDDPMGARSILKLVYLNKFVFSNIKIYLHSIFR